MLKKNKKSCCCLSPFSGQQGKPNRNKSILGSSFRLLKPLMPALFHLSPGVKSHSFFFQSQTRTNLNFLRRFCAPSLRVFHHSGLARFKKNRILPLVLNSFLNSEIGCGRSFIAADSKINSFCVRRQGLSSSLRVVWSISSVRVWMCVCTVWSADKGEGKLREWGHLLAIQSHKICSHTHLNLPIM